MQEVRLVVSKAWFEKNVYTHVNCPYCGKQVQVIVATSSIERCTYCKKRFSVEFKEVG